MTFSKDVAPIFQRACQNCHRPGAIAPMSLLTYDDARPWARSIRQKVTSREMPPWFIDRQVGVRKFKDDPSLTDQEIATIAAWVDGGAVKGNGADLPPPRHFADADSGTSATPDLDHLAAGGPRRAGRGARLVGRVLRRLRADGGSLHPGGRDEAGEGRPLGRPPCHHLLLDDRRQDGAERSVMLNEYALGKNGDFFPENAGRLMKAGTQDPLPDALPLERQGNPGSDQWSGSSSIPKGYVPKYLQISSTIGDSPEDLDIPAGEANVRHDGYYRLEKPTLLVSFQPHMHLRGKSMCVEAILPTMRVQPISCAKMELRLEPRLHLRRRCRAAPAGRHDPACDRLARQLAGQPANPDPRNWAGYGGRTLDEMSFAWMNYYYLSDEDYQQELARRAKPTH